MAVEAPYSPPEKLSDGSALAYGPLLALPARSVSGEYRSRAPRGRGRHDTPGRTGSPSCANRPDAHACGQEAMHIDSGPAYGEVALGVDDPLALSDLFGDYIRRFGADGFAYALLTPAGKPDPSRTVAQMPDGWVDRYFEKAYFDIDPQFPAVRETARPFLWSRSFDWRDVGRAAARLFRDAARFGLAEAVTFTLPGPRGPDAVMAVAGCDRKTLADLFEARLEPLHIAVLEFHLMVRPLLDRRCEAIRDWKLTTRERECFQWIARGKSSWEIGQILGISERTVAFHIDNVKRKIGVGSRIQALVKLVLAGDIEP
jgi:LuxR family quorum-sensing system transcriptional regulator CciR